MRRLWPVAGVSAWILWYGGHLVIVWTDVNDAMLDLE